MRSFDLLRVVIVQQNNMAQVWQKRCCSYFTGNLWIIHLWFGAHLGGYWFHSNEEVSMAVHEWLQMEEPRFFHRGILNFCQGGTCALINVFGDYVEK